MNLDLNPISFEHFNFFQKKEKLNLDFFLLSQETWLLCVFNIFVSNQANPREVLANCIQSKPYNKNKSNTNKNNSSKVEHVLQNAAKSYV